MSDHQLEEEMDEPNTISKTLDAVAGAVPPEAQDRMKADANAAVAEARDVLDTARHEAGEQLSAIKEQAQEQLAGATDKAKSFAAEQKDSAADQLGGIATAISKVADELEDGSQGMAAGYARDLAGGVKSVSETVKSRNVDELIAMTEDFGRKQPLAFLGAAALAGFVASRFVLASAARRAGSAPGSGQDPAPSTPASAPLSTRGDL